MEMKMNKLRGSFVGAVLSLAVWGVAFAHGPVTPMHGGVATKIGDIQYEQVVKGDAAIIYLYDHGKAVPTKGASGKLTILNGTEKTELTLTPVGENTLRAQGGKFTSGTKSVALISLVGEKPVTVRFSIK
jgi:hypothetical protein